MNHIRQGDVLILLADAIPTDAVELPRDADGALTLMHGEATGHRHRFAEPHVHLYETPRKERYLRVVATSNLLHEEHTTHKVPPGIYRVPMQVEYTPSELTRVAD